MLKIIKTDLFRLFRTKAFYVYPIFLVFVEIMSACFSVVRMTDGDAEVIVDFAARSVKCGPVDYASCLGDGLLILFLGIAMAIFYTNESRNGFLKNAAGCAVDKRLMPVSKMIAGVVTMFVYIAEYIVIRTVFMLIETLTSGAKLEYTGIPEGDGGKFAVYVLLCLFVHIACIAILVLMHELTHSRALMLLSVFVFSATLADKIIVGAFGLLKSKFTWLSGININKYMMMLNIENGYLSKSYYPLTLFIVCMIYFGLGAILSATVANRKDVK